MGATTRQVLITLNIDTKSGKAAVLDLGKTVADYAATATKEEKAAAEAATQSRQKAAATQGELIKRRAKEIGDAARIEMAILLRNSEEQVKLAEGDAQKINSIRQNAFYKMQESIGESLTALKGLGDAGALTYESIENKLRNMSKRIETGNTAFGQLIKSTQDVGIKFMQANQRMDEMVQTLRKLEAAGKKGSTEYKAIQQSLGAVSIEASKLEAQMKNLDAAAKRQANGMAQGFDALKKQLGPVGDQLGGIGMQAGAMTSAMLTGGDSVQALTGAIGGVAGMFGPFGAAVSIAVGILGQLIGKMETTAEAAKRTKEEFAAASATSNAFAAASANVNVALKSGDADDMATAVASITGELERAGGVSLTAKTELEALLNLPGGPTVESLSQIEQIMTRLNEQASLATRVAAEAQYQAALENSKAALETAASETAGWFSNVQNFFSSGTTRMLEAATVVDSLQAKIAEGGKEGREAQIELDKVQLAMQEQINAALEAGLTPREALVAYAEENEGVSRATLELYASQADQLYAATQAKEEATALAAEQAAFDAEVLDLQHQQTDAAIAQLQTQDEINFANGTTTAEKLAQLEAAKAQIVAEKQQALALLTKLQAAGKGTQQLNKLTAEAANLAGKYAKNMGREGVEVAKASTEDIIAGLRAEIEGMDAGIAKIDAQIAKVKPKSGGGGKRGESDIEKEAKRQADALAKAMEAYQNAIEKAEEEYNKELQKIAEARQKRAIDEEVEAYKIGLAKQQAEEAQAEAARKLASEIDSIRKNAAKDSIAFNTGQLDKLDQMLSQFYTPLELATRQIVAMTKSNQAYLEQKQAELEQVQRDLATNMEQQRTVNSALQSARDELFEFSRSAGNANERLIQLPEEIARAKLAEATAQAEVERTKAGAGQNRVSPEVLAAAMAALQGLSPNARGRYAQADIDAARAAAAAAGVTFREGNAVTANIAAALEEVRKAQEALAPLLAAEERATRARARVLQLEAEQSRITSVAGGDERLQGAASSEVATREKQAQELEATIARLQAQMEALTQSIANYQTNRAKDLAVNVAKLNGIFEVQNKIQELERERAHTSDPAHLENLDNALRFQRDYLEELKGSEESYQTLLKSTDELAKAEGNLKAQQLVAETAEARAAEADALDQIAIKTRRLGEIQDNLADSNERLARAENLKAKQGQLERQAVLLSEQVSATRNLLELKRQSFEIEGLTADEYNRINGEVETLTNQLTAVQQAQTANTAALVENAKARKDENDQLAKRQAEQVQSLFGELKAGLEKVGSADLSSAFDSIFGSIKNLSSETATATEKMQAGIQMATGFASALASIPATVEKYRKDFEEGGPGAIVKDVSGDVSKIGSALLTSGVPPLMVVGAALLAAGIIGNIIGQLVSAFVGRAKTQVEAAEDIAASEQKVQGIYQSQISAARTLKELGNSRVDTAREMLALLKQEHDILVANSGFAARAAAMSDKALAASSAQMEMNQKRQEDLMRTGERSLELGRDERVAWLNAQGIQVEWWQNTSIMVEDQLKKLEAQGLISEEMASALKAELDYRKAIGSELKNQLSELQSTRDLLIDIALRSNSYAKALHWSNKNLAQGVINVNRALGKQFKTADEAMRWLNSQGVDYFQNLSEEQRGYVKSLMSAYESVGDAVFADQENLINLRKEAGVYAEEEAANADIAKQKLLELYNQELTRLISINATEEEQLALRIKIRDLMAEQNEELDDQNKKYEKLNDLVRQHQQALVAERAGATQGQASATRDAIKNELTNLGWSPDDIAEFMATLPPRAAGGPMTKGLYQVGEKGTEWAMQAAAVRKYGQGFMEKVNNLSFPAPAANIGSQSAGFGGGQSVIINWSPTYTINGGDTNRVREVVTQSDAELYRKVNQGIRSRQISVTNGGRS
jgi:hypothetical protein